MQTADLESLVERTMAELGRLDLLVNNAGGTPPRAAFATSERYFETALRFNVTDGGTESPAIAVPAPRL